MKELSSNELKNVSGGLILGAIFGGIGSALGTAIGTIVDTGTAAAGYKTDFTSSGKSLGFGIGGAVGFSPTIAITGMTRGIVGIIGNSQSLRMQQDKLYGKQ